MKKILCFVLSVFMLFTLSVGVSAYTVNEDDAQIGAGDIFGNAVSGDINGDEKIDSVDLAVLKIFLATEERNESVVNPDVDGDGLEDSSDLAALKLILAGAK